MVRRKLDIAVWIDASYTYDYFCEPFEELLALLMRPDEIPCGGVEYE